MKKSISKPVLSVTIISPHETHYSGEAYSVSAINRIGPFDILPGHINFMSLLTRGKIELATPTGQQSYPIARGILKVNSDNVMIFANV